MWKLNYHIFDFQVKYCTDKSIKLSLINAWYIEFKVEKYKPFKNELTNYVTLKMFLLFLLKLVRCYLQYFFENYFI